SSLAALATLDGNHDGRIDAKDADFAHLQVWMDVNQDGISAPQELFTLSQLEITGLGLGLDRTGAAVMNGNKINGFATVDYADGHQGSMAEVQLDSDRTAPEQTPQPDNAPPASTASESLPHGGLAEILNWEGVALRHEGDTLTMVEYDSGLDLNKLLANQPALTIHQVDMTGAGNNTLNIHDVLDLSDNEHPLRVDGNAGDVVNLQNLLDTVLATNSAVSVNGVSHATDATGHAMIGAESYVAYKSLDGLHTLLVDTEVVINFTR
ncbi:MAG: hypothetical protein HQL95_14835, partial [Magnetococcales bacterium]|nr:hypothetical protein [Magnetococcales bacterium]